jgi:hypothetical protein
VAAVLRDVDLDQGFEQLTRGLDVEDRRRRRLRRRGWNAAAAGVALQIGGMIVSTFGRDSGQAGGSTAGATHAGHILILAGLAVAALGAFVALVGPSLYETDRPASGGRRVLGLVVPFAVVAVVAAGVATVQSTVLHGGNNSGTNVTTSAAPGAGAVLGLTSTNSDVNAASAIPDQPLDPATRQKLADQLVLARETALKYPTVADAVKAGMYLAGGFAPGSGAHYMSMAGVAKGIMADGVVNPAYPASFIYDGTKPTSRIVGLMYISLADNPPAGFAGPNDHWHRHFNLCVQYTGHGITTPFPADADITAAECTAIPGAQFMQKTVWMVHAWVVPGWESPDGVFSHANTDLRCGDGTYNTNAVGFCQGT